MALPPARRCRSSGGTGVPGVTENASEIAVLSFRNSRREMDRGMAQASSYQLPATSCQLPAASPTPSRRALCWKLGAGSYCVRSIAMTSCTSTDGTVTVIVRAAVSVAGRRPGGQQLHLPGAGSFGEPDAHRQGPDRDDFAQRALHHHRVRQVDEVHGHRVALTPDGHVQEPGTGDFDRRRLVRGPRHDVPQQPAVIDGTSPPRTCGRCPTGCRPRGCAGSAGDTARACRCARRAGRRPPSADRDSVGISVTGDGNVGRRRHLHAEHAVDDPRRVVEPVEDRMALSRRRIGVEAQVRVLHRPVDPSGERHAEEVGEAEVVAPPAPLVVERGGEGRERRCRRA